MKNVVLFFSLLITGISASAQHLNTERYDDCHLGPFILDGGSPKAELPENAATALLDAFNRKAVSDIEGDIRVQILIDTVGRPCLLSAVNNSNVSSRTLGLQGAINSMPHWRPALENDIPTNTSVSLDLKFQEGRFRIERVVFDFSRNTNMRSVGVSDVQGSPSNDLSVRWKVFDQTNSDLPWDMTRSIAADQNNDVWVSTDNGVVRISDEQMTVYNSSNSPIQQKRNRSFTTHLSIDANNAIWFSDGYNAYRILNGDWTVFDTLNYPLRWTNGIIPDNQGNVYFKTSRGLRKYDGETWSVIDSMKLPLPSENISAVYEDQQNRLWIGTYDGNIRLDGELIESFSELNNPLAHAAISKVYEDAQGTFWFDLYSKDKSRAGLWKLEANGQWSSVRPSNSELFTKNDINDFLVDERNQVVWIALNSVGLIRYGIEDNTWEVYTPENSDVPSVHVMKLTIDKDGIVWAATFAGVIKMIY